MSNMEWWFKKAEVEMTEFRVRAFELLDRFYFGWHHCPIDRFPKFKKAFSGGNYVEFTTKGTMATYDFDELTRLVFLAHDMCLRVEIAPSANRLKIFISDRKRPGEKTSMCSHHPRLDAAVAKWREHNTEVWEGWVDSLPPGAEPEDMAKKEA